MQYTSSVFISLVSSSVSSLVNDKCAFFSKVSVAIFGLGAVGLAVNFSSLLEAAHSFGIYY